jgi:hypothetical protein
VVDDFGVDFDYEAEAARWHRSSRNARKLKEYTAKTEVNWIATRRPGKALLVLDLDHTLLDFTNAREGGLRISDLLLFSPFWALF